MLLSVLLHILYVTAVMSLRCAFIHLRCTPQHVIQHSSQKQITAQMWKRTAAMRGICRRFALIAIQRAIKDLFVIIFSYLYAMHSRH